MRKSVDAEEEYDMVDGATFPRMRSRRGGLGKNEGHSVLKNRDEESLGGPILTSGGSSH